ncbi:MAG: 4-hydroxy-3-methylbut-2-enyl diphosphate reductase [Anaerorhabdus sp.]
MKIIPITPRGYCKGVVQAINLAKKTRKDYPTAKISMLGMIVHNQHVIDACRNIGIECVEHKGKSRLDLLDDIHEGIVIFTAHGVSDQVIEKAISKGLVVVDASCSDVTKTKEIVKDHLLHNAEVLYIGKSGHPEAEAITSLSSKVHLITSTADIDNLPQLPNVVLTNQTTMSILEVANLIDHAKKKYPHLIVEEEICSATRVRQEALQQLNHVDCLLVVGDPKSNNTLKLREIAIHHHIPKIYLIETANDLQEKWLCGVETIAVTSGASTPTLLTEQVLIALEAYNEQGFLSKIEIDYSKLL